MEHQKNNKISSSLNLCVFTAALLVFCCQSVLRVQLYSGPVYIFEMMGCDGKHASSAAAQVTFTAERLGVRSIQRSARQTNTLLAVMDYIFARSPGMADLVAQILIVCVRASQ